MKVFKIKLASLSQVQDFVSAASLQHCDVEIVSQDCTIDAKSIFGLVTLDLTQPLTVRYQGEEAAAWTFQQQIHTYLLA